MIYILGDSPRFIGDNMARDLTAYGFAATNIIVPAGVSLSVLVLPMAGEISMSLKYVSGGTLEIFNVPSGATSTIVQTPGTGYAMGANEIINASGAPKFQLVATGATTLCALLVSLSQPG